MSVTSKNRGWSTYYDEENKVWRYSDNNQIVSEERECAHCRKKPILINGIYVDACIGYLKGFKSVCCGHGNKKDKIFVRKKGT